MEAPVSSVSSSRCLTQAQEAQTTFWPWKSSAAGATRAAFLPYVTEDLRLRADSAKMNVSLYSETLHSDHFLVPESLIMFSSCAEENAPGPRTGHSARCYEEERKEHAPPSRPTGTMPFIFITHDTNIYVPTQLLKWYFIYNDCKGFRS